MKKLCSISYWVLSWAFLFGVSLIGFGAKEVRAVDTIYLDSYYNIDSSGDETRNDPVFSISFEVPTDCPNPYLMTVSSSWNGNVLNSVSYNGDSLTQLYQAGSLAGGNIRGSIFGLANPDTGTNTLTFTTDSIGERPTLVALYCNVDPNDPIGTVFTLGETSNQTSLDSGSITDYENDNSALISVLYLFETDSSDVVPNGSVLVSQTDTWNQARVAMAYNDDVSNPPAQFTWTKSGPGYVGSLLYAVLNPAPASGCSPGYILVNDVCIFNGVELGNLFFSSPYSCSNTSSCKIKYSYNENYFTPYDYIEYFRYDSATSTSPTSIGTSTIIDASVFGKENGDSFLTLTGTSTISGLTYYDVVAHMAEYYDVSLATTVPATTTSATMFIVDWGLTDVYDWTVQFNSDNSTSTDNVLNVNTYDLACNADEWASTSSVPILGWNVDRTLCKTKKWLLDTFLSPAWWVSNKVKQTGNVLKNTFPFGIILKFQSSWVSSATTSLPSELSWLDIADENGNVYIAFPKEWAGTESDIQMLVWGTDVFTPAGSKIADVFAGIKVLSKYLMWVMFLFGIFSLAKNIYKELQE